MRDKRMFCGIMISGTTFCQFSSTIEHKNIADRLMLFLDPI